MITPLINDTPENPMTTTEPQIASPSADTVRDPSWVRARIQKALAQAEAFGEDWVKDSPGFAGDRSRAMAVAELSALKVRLETLCTHLRVHGPEGDVFLADLQMRVPAQWTRSVSDFYTGGSVADAEKWAAQLGLPEQERLETGSRMWAGDIDGFRVEIFGQ
ncbi:hypothetical protein [Nocardia fusca]|uniref:Uncharacterized protein n=1 Tax=Nocardia fusca TaxID=941183 RepID=A0ABV3FIJ8_9NOCA